MGDVTEMRVDPPGGIVMRVSRLMKGVVVFALFLARQKPDGWCRVDTVGMACVSEASITMVIGDCGGRSDG